MPTPNAIGYNLEIFPKVVTCCDNSSPGIPFSIYVAAGSGSILGRKTIVHDGYTCYSYRVVPICEGNELGSPSEMQCSTIPVIP